jgi:RNA polymerase sigma factor (sigma-70 family)
VTVSAARGSGDALLVARCLDGDGAAWTELVERHGALVWAVASRARLERADAEDVFQATWTIALEELSRIREPERFAAWIARVARHQTMRVRRGYGIARRAHERVAADLDETRVPDDELERLEERGRVTRALTRLGARCRDLLQLLYYADPRPAYEVVSERLGMRIGSIGPTRARCLQKLERELGGEG